MSMFELRFCKQGGKKTMYKKRNVRKETSLKNCPTSDKKGGILQNINDDKPMTSSPYVC